MHADPLPVTRRRLDAVIAAVLFVFCALLYRLSPVSIPIDSHYSMLLSEHILKHGSFALDEYFKPPLSPRHYIGMRPPSLSDSPYPYHIYEYHGHLYYYFAPGTSLLSLPFVAAYVATGHSMIDASGLYDPSAERRVERMVAAFATAGTVVLLYLLARCRLSPLRSTALALIAAFGSALWSTASRVTWSHTWGLFVLSALLLFLCRGGKRLNTARGGFAVGTLLALLYIVRPAFSVTILCVGLFMLLRHRRAIVGVATAGILWGAAFLAYAWQVSGALFPPYYRGGANLATAHAASNLALHLLSPSRGLLVYTPALFCALFLALRNVRTLRHDPLFMLAVAGIAAHLALLAFFPSTGDYAYGARLATDMLPWIALVAVLAWAEDTGRPPRFALRAVASLLIALGFCIQARGAFSMDTQYWNAFPCAIKTCPERYWDWSFPQFAAGLLPWPGGNSPPPFTVYKD